MAANQVTVATPGPAGVPGLTYEGVWTVGDVYQVRDCARFQDGNLYVVNVQHTAANSNNPLLNTIYWTLFINADDAFQWATKSHYALIGDSLGQTGYSSLHQAKQSEHWASLTTDAVRNDTNLADVDYSAKAWAIGGTEVTTTNLRGASKEWAIAAGLVDTASYSSKEYAQGTAASTGGSSKSWSQDTDGVNGAGANDRSAKAWSQGASMTGATLGGSSKDWAQLLVTAIDATSFSSKEYAQGVTASTGGSAKDWATYTAADVRGAGSGDMSAKEWAVGVLGRTVAGEGSSKDWATRTTTTVDNAEYSSKEYAQGAVLAAGGSAKNWAQLATTPTTTATDASAKEWAIGVATHKNEGSAKEWAVYTAGDVRGASAGSMSSKEWAIGVLGRGVSGEGSSKDWATRLAATVDNADYSAKEWSIGTTVATGSSKDWATKTSAAVNTTFSAKEYAQGTQASTGGSAKNWATQTGADITGASSGDMSSKEWAIGTLGRTVAGEGSSKDWATRTGAAVDDSEYSAKEYALGTTVAVGSAKDWAILPENSVVDGGTGYSALHWAAKAATSYDNFDDRFLGSHSTATREVGANIGKDNDGDTLLDGALYYDTTLNVLKVWNLTDTQWDQITPTAAEQTAIDIVGGELLYLEDLGLITQTPTTSSGNNISDVADNETNINLVAGQISPTNNVGALGPVAANITAVATAPVPANMAIVAPIAANITTVAGVAANVTTVAGIHANVTSVAGDATDIGVVAGKATEIGRLGTADAVADLAILATNAIVADMAILATADIVADMAILGTADVVTDMNVLGTADVVTDMNVLATADVVTDMNTLGTADVVTDMNVLGTADVVSDMNTLGTGGNVTNMNTLAGIAANITTVAGISANTTTVAGISANVTSVAANEANVNRYADEYTISGSQPGSPSEGDLWYDSSNNALKFHNGNNFAIVAAETHTQMSDDSTPTLGGNLDVGGNSIVSVSNADITIAPHGNGEINLNGTVNTDNLTIDFGSIA